MEVDSVFITGANRGLGLEFVKQLVKLPKPPSFVFATYRDESSAQALKEIQDASKDVQVVLIKLDITKKDDIESAYKVVESKVGDRGLNLLINNAGYMNHQGLHDITEENMLSHFTINTVGPVMVLKELLPLLQKSASRKTSGLNVSRAAVLNISSIGGSIGFLSNQMRKELVKDSASKVEPISYRTTKCALNMAMRVAALTVKDQGILIVNMCPGWVKTDMGTQGVPDAVQNPDEATRKVLNELIGQETILTTEQSISAMLKTLSELNESHHGAFIDRNGKTIPF